MPRPLLILAAFAFPASAQEKITYDEHVFPIFEQACLNCHNPDKTKGGLDLSSFNATLKGSSGGKIVEPGDTDSSLITAVRQSAEPIMPPEGEKLPNTLITTLTRWIEGGLLENSKSTARKKAKPKFKAIVHSNPATKPDGPPPMPEHLLLEPPVVTRTGAAVRAITCSPWAPLIAITGQHQVLLHHTETLAPLAILPFPEGDPISLAFTPDARYLIVGGGVPGKSGITVTFDITTGERQLSAGKEFDSILAADIRPGFDIVATGGPSRLLKLWDTQSGQLFKSVIKHTDWITALDISPDGVLLASGDRNGGVWVWESDTANEFHTLRAHQAAITATAFRADSDILATASEDGTLRFWEMNGGSELKKIDAHPGGVTAFSFARDGTSLSAGRDFKAKLWKPDFNHARDLSIDSPDLPTSAALTADGKRAFIGNARGTVLVFNTADGNALGKIHNNPPRIEDRLKTIAASLAESKNAIGTTENKELRDQAQAAHSALEKSHKFWTAAAINTRLLESHCLADRFSQQTTDSQLSFTEAAAILTTQATILNRKRSERLDFATSNKIASITPETQIEIQATLAAIDTLIAREFDAYKTAETTLTQIRNSIDPSAKLAHQKKREAASHQQAYRKALGK